NSTKITHRSTPTSIFSANRFSLHFFQTALEQLVFAFQLSSSSTAATFLSSLSLFLLYENKAKLVVMFSTCIHFFLNAVVEHGMLCDIYHNIQSGKEICLNCYDLYKNGGSDDGKTVYRTITHR
ncbi:hypothetical protein, partial [Parageobacillus thermoglucosidasius]|uniref:hypothetical protein n=1 Tax=Parageobacillus thermoglucosidasius TaxID=1426 RepID=UPI00242B8FA0